MCQPDLLVSSSCKQILFNKKADLAYALRICKTCLNLNLLNVCLNFQTAYLFQTAYIIPGCLFQTAENPSRASAFCADGEAWQLPRPDAQSCSPDTPGSFLRTNTSARDSRRRPPKPGYAWRFCRGTSDREK